MKKEKKLIVMLAFSLLSASLFAADPVEKRSASQGLPNDDHMSFVKGYNDEMYISFAKKNGGKNEISFLAKDARQN